ASDLELPKVDQRLPRAVLTIGETERVLALPDLETPFGVRDRAMLEVLYSTGIRRQELIALTIWDLDPERGLLTVRKGKGRKDRVVPAGERAISWIARYSTQARPRLVVPPDAGVLFLTKEGLDFTPDHLSGLVTRYVERANLGKHGSCHLFRHTMATLMLEGGADIRYIQAMLGHAELSSTQLYTQVAVGTLKAVHAACHPGATLGPHRRSADHPALGNGRDDPDDLDGLLAALDHEATEEERRVAR
ncbi:MAG: tyrosine-type recombinase/integrase, partial [Acidimicrobiia bacterium]